MSPLSLQEFDNDKLEKFSEKYDKYVNETNIENYKRFEKNNCDSYLRYITENGFYKYTYCTFHNFYF
jgi:hypothetical protein